MNKKIKIMGKILILCILLLMFLYPLKEYAILDFQIKEKIENNKNYLPNYINYTGIFNENDIEDIKKNKNVKEVTLILNNFFTYNSSTGYKAYGKNYIPSLKEYKPEIVTGRLIENNQEVIVSQNVANKILENTKEKNTEKILNKEYDYHGIKYKIVGIFKTQNEKIINNDFFYSFDLARIINYLNVNDKGNLNKCENDYACEDLSDNEKKIYNTWDGRVKKAMQKVNNEDYEQKISEYENGMGIESEGFVIELKEGKIEEFLQSKEYKKNIQNLKAEPTDGIWDVPYYKYDDYFINYFSTEECKVELINIIFQEIILTLIMIYVYFKIFFKKEDGNNA